MTQDELNIASRDYAKSLAGEICDQTGKLNFTGWKGSDTSEGYVAQWCDYRRSRIYHYVNLPGMQHGDYQTGDTFNIGNQRVFLNTPIEEILRLIREGYELIQQQEVHLV